MKPIKFRFSRAEIKRHSICPSDWHRFVRRREFELIASCFYPWRPSNAIELGAGDGAQSETISKYVERLTCTELLEEGNIGFGGRFVARNLENVSYEICDAMNLEKFEAGSFDFVFSSNMLEHVSNVDACLAECARVLKKGGLMVHVTPSRDWKFFNYVCTLAKGGRPLVHGVSNGDFQEFLEFGESRWLKKLEKRKFKVEALARMPFYIGLGPTFLQLIIFGNWLGFKSSTAYFCRLETDEA